MVTTKNSSVPSMAPTLACGKLTWTPCWMIGAVTMKITSNTSMTSTRGVTLICEIVVPPPGGGASKAIRTSSLLALVPIVQNVPVVNLIVSIKKKTHRGGAEDAELTIFD